MYILMSLFVASDLGLVFAFVMEKYLVIVLGQFSPLKRCGSKLCLNNLQSRV